MPPFLKNVDIPVELARIEGMGFVRTLKPGDTGVGFTLETLLGLRPTNRRGVADISYLGNPVELKSQRSRTDSMVTLFTCEPGFRVLKDRDLIRKYGYVDPNGRLALYVTLTTQGPVPQGLVLRNDSQAGTVAVVDAQGEVPWRWTYSQFSAKIDKLLAVKAETRGRGPSEEFHYNWAVLYEGLDLGVLAGMLDSGSMVVDIRAHIKTGRNAARNHGTGFRIRSLAELNSLYRAKTQVLGN